MSMLPPSDLEGPAGENAAKNTAKNATEPERSVKTENTEKEPFEADKPTNGKKSRTRNPVIRHVVGNQDKDDVSLSRAVYKNPRARKSLTVHHIQRRLGELGYTLAYADREGWYGDLTKESVAAFQKDEGLEPTGLMDSGTFESLFDGDVNVNVVP